jgi:hypothetical protein
MLVTMRIKTIQPLLDDLEKVFLYDKPGMPVRIEYPLELNDPFLVL